MHAAVTTRAVPTLPFHPQRIAPQNNEKMK
jgi:hypothetical protein